MGSRRQKYLKKSKLSMRSLQSPTEMITTAAAAADEVKLCGSDSMVAGGRESISSSIMNYITIRRQEEEEENEEEEDSIEALTRGTCGSLKRMILRIDKRYMVPLFTHSDNRHEPQQLRQQQQQQEQRMGRLRSPEVQQQQQQNDEGGIFLCETASRLKRSSGYRRRNRFSSAVIGRLTHSRRHTQDSESSLPTVGFSSFRLRESRAATAAVDSRRRTASQQSGSTGMRNSSRSAASAPPGRLTKQQQQQQQQSSVFGGTSKECSVSPAVSNSGSNRSSSGHSTDIERRSARLLQQQQSANYDSSNNIRVRNHRDLANMTVASSATAREVELTANGPWSPQQIDQLVDNERRQMINSDNILPARIKQVDGGSRNGLLSWTSSQLRRVSRGFFSGAAVVPDVHHSTRRGSLFADLPEAVDINNKVGGHHERRASEYTSVVAANQNKRSSTGDRSSGSRGLHFLRSDGAANTIASSSGNSQTKDFMNSAGKTRRQTYRQYAGSFRRQQQQAQYQPLQEHLEQTGQVDDSNIRSSVDPVVLGRQRYDTELNESRPSGEVTAAAAAASGMGYALGSGPPAAKRIPPINAAAEDIEPLETMISLPRLVSEPSFGKASIDEAADTEDEVEERIRGKEPATATAAAVPTQATAGHAAAAASHTLQEQQAGVHSHRKKSLDRNANDHNTTAVHQSEEDVPLQLSVARPPRAPPVLRHQHIMQQQSHELQAEKTQPNVEAMQADEQLQRFSQGGERQEHVQQHERQNRNQMQWLEASRSSVADRHTSVPEVDSETFDTVTPIEQQGRPEATTATMWKVALPSAAATPNASALVSPVPTTLDGAVAVASEAPNEPTTPPVLSPRELSRAKADTAVVQFNNVLHP